MKKRQSHKPTRKCHSCGLNLGDQCGIYPAPRKQWGRRPCPGYENGAMLAQYEMELARQLPDPAKQKRREVAKQRSSEPHWQGTLPYAYR